MFFRPIKLGENKANKTNTAFMITIFNKNQIDQIECGIYNLKFYVLYYISHEVFFFIMMKYLQIIKKPKEFLMYRL